MAPSKRRRTSGPTASTAKPSQQSTLAFNRTKPNLPSHEPANKIAKPSVAKPPLKSHKGEKPATPSPQVADVHVPATKTEEAPPEDGVEEPVVVEDDDEARARRISETQIKQYWAAKERARKAGRVHQEGLGVREKVLREFDMTSRYGVSFPSHNAEACRLRKVVPGGKLTVVLHSQA